LRNLVLAIALTGVCFAQTDTERLGALQQETVKLYREGKYAEALPLAQSAVELAQKTVGADHPETATSLNNLAFLYESQGQYAKAEPLFLRAQAILEKALGADHPDTASSLNNLATLYRSQRQYGKAEPLYVRALAIREKVLGADHPDTATSLNNLASLYHSEGHYAKAEPLYMRALAIRKKALGADHPSTATSLNDLASLYESQRQYAKAEPLYVRALAIREKALGADHPTTSSSLNNLALCYTLQGQYAKAEPLYVRALAISEKALGADHPDTDASLNNLAALYKLQGQYAKAEPLYVRALAIIEKALGADHPFTATSLNNLAALYASQGQYEKAEPLYVRALAIREKALGAEHPTTSMSQANLAVNYLDRGANDQAQKVLEKGWPEQLKYLERSLQYGRESFRRKAVDDAKAQLSLLIAVQKDNHKIRELGLKAILATKARVFEETEAALQSLRPRLEPDLQKKLDELTAVRAERNLRAARTTAANPDRQKELAEREELLVAELTEKSLEFREQNPPPDLTVLRERLGPAALVELVIYDEFFAPRREGTHRGPPRYGAYVLTVSGGVQWHDLGPAGDIDRLVRRFRAAINLPDNQAVSGAAAREIDRLTLEPIRKSLPGVKEFYVAADGLLRLIPLAALRDAAGVNLIENFKIHTLLTGRDLLRGAPLHSAQPPWVGGLEEFGKRGAGMFFRPIPGAAAEALEVAKVMKPKPQLLSPEQMTKSFLMDKMNGPRILHLATHGYYRGAEGGLALRDANVSEANILTHSDAAKLKLFGTQLAVLSACETGLGEVSFADGITGLQRSLTLAGARSQILTLWPVSDGKTKELMVSFYRNLFEKGMTKSEALRQAQLEMARQGVDEYYWAPFVLYGDGGPLGQ
jgi:CHAT domain-containing protein/Tfp pilus assembly protein PilF